MAAAGDGSDALPLPADSATDPQEVHASGAGGLMDADSHPGQLEASASTGHPASTVAVEPTPLPEDAARAEQQQQPPEDAAGDGAIVEPTPLPDDNDTVLDPTPLPDDNGVVDAVEAQDSQDTAVEASPDSTTVVGEASPDSTPVAVETVPLDSTTVVGEASTDSTPVAVEAPQDSHDPAVETVPPDSTTVAVEAPQDSTTPRDNVPSGDDGDGPTALVYVTPADDGEYKGEVFVDTSLPGGDTEPLQSPFAAAVEEHLNSPVASSVAVQSVPSSDDGASATGAEPRRTNRRQSMPLYLPSAIPMELRRAGTQRLALLAANAPPAAAQSGAVADATTEATVEATEKTEAEQAAPSAGSPAVPTFARMPRRSFSGFLKSNKYNITPRQQLEEQIAIGKERTAATSLAISMALGASLGGIMTAGVALASVHASTGAMEATRRRSHAARTLKFFEKDQKTAQQMQAERRAARARAKRKKAALANGVVAAGSSSDEESDEEEGVDGFDDGRFDGAVLGLRGMAAAELQAKRQQRFGPDGRPLTAPKPESRLEGLKRAMERRMAAMQLRYDTKAAKTTERRDRRTRRMHLTLSDVVDSLRSQLGSDVRDRNQEGLAAVAALQEAAEEGVAAVAALHRERRGMYLEDTQRVIDEAVGRGEAQFAEMAQAHEAAVEAELDAAEGRLEELQATIDAEVNEIKRHRSDPKRFEKMERRKAQGREEIAAMRVVNTEAMECVLMQREEREQPVRQAFFDDVEPLVQAKLSTLRQLDAQRIASTYTIRDDTALAVSEVEAVAAADVEALKQKAADSIYRLRQRCKEAVDLQGMQCEEDVQRMTELLDVQVHKAERDYREEQGTIHEHCHMGYLLDVEWFLNNGCTVQDLDKYSRLPLHWAMQGGHAHVAKALLQHGSPVDVLDNLDEAPIHKACRKHHTAAALACIDEGCDVTIPNHEGDTPLHLAASCGDARVVKELVEAEADMDVYNKAHRTPLMEAALTGKYAAIKALLRKKADHKLSDADGRTALHLAALKGHRKATYMLVQFRSDLNARDKLRMTPLHMAGRGGHAAPVYPILQGTTWTLNANPRLTDKFGQTALHRMAFSGNAEGCKALIEIGKSRPDVEDRFQRSTPLHLAAMQGASRCCETLLESGANIEARNIDGDTPLHVAARNGYAGTCAALIAQGAQLEARTPRGEWTPLLHAAKAGRTVVVRTLVRAGADVNAALPSGWTALHWACKRGDTTMATVLIDAGASLSTENRQGQRAIDLMSSRMLATPQLAGHVAAVDASLLPKPPTPPPSTRRSSAGSSRASWSS